MEIVRDIDFLSFTGRQESQFIENASEWTDEVVERFNGDLGQNGDLLPWSKTHNSFAMRPGEVTIWGGYSGHGKSQILGQVSAWGIRDKKWLIASMEMKPSATMQRMVRQVATTSAPHEDYIRRFMKWTDGKLWIYDQTDSVQQDRILGMVHYASQELGINHIIIDSLIKCGIGRDDYEKQAKFVDSLCWAAKTNNIHIHIVHHMRKGSGVDSEYITPGKHDFRGAGEITDLVDNVLIIHRNKRKEEKIRNGEEGWDDKPDCTLGIVKQRHGEYEGVVSLWFNQQSMQYTPSSSNRPMTYEVSNESY